MGRLASLLIFVGLAALLLAAQPREASAPRPGPEQTPPSQPLAIVVNRANSVDDLSMPELRKDPIVGRWSGLSSLNPRGDTRLRLSPASVSPPSPLGTAPRGR